MADGLFALDRYRDARRCVLSASAQARCEGGTLLPLAHALRRLNESQALFALADSARGSASPTTLTELASLVSSAGGQALAQVLVEAAVAADPLDAHARYLHGVILMFQGDVEQAAWNFEVSLQLAPDFAQAHWMLSGARGSTAGHDRVERVRGSLQRCVANTTAEAYLCFALHNELDILGEYEQAWQALARGCAVKRRLVRYDQAASAALFADIKRICTPQFIASTAPAPEPGMADATPIFILGMHRSGTTLLERILSGHSQVADGGETYLFTAQLSEACDHDIAGALDARALTGLAGADFSAIGGAFVRASTWRARGKPFFTEKLPPNLLNAGLIAKALPGARILHMVRDPMDTCFSNLRTYFGNAAGYSYEQQTLTAYHGHYRDLMRHWHAVMPGRILDVSYQDLVDDTETTARKVLAFCGLPIEISALDPAREGGSVATASHAQIRRGVLKDRGGAWHPYAHHLQRMLDVLAESRRNPFASPG